MTTPPSIHDVWLSPTIQVGVLASSTVRIICDHEELHLMWPASMSPADKAAKCAAIAHLFAAEGMRYSDLDASLVPVQRDGSAS